MTVYLSPYPQGWSSMSDAARVAWLEADRQERAADLVESEWVAHMASDLAAAKDLLIDDLSERLTIAEAYASAAGSCIHCSPVAAWKGLIADAGRSI